MFTLYYAHCICTFKEEPRRQSSYKKNEKRLARSFNFTFRYDVLTINNSRFGDFVDHIYHIELEIKDTTDKDMSASYLDNGEK
jgi:hypothetical protein